MIFDIKGSISEKSSKLYVPGSSDTGDNYDNGYKER